MTLHLRRAGSLHLLGLIKKLTRWPEAVVGRGPTNADWHRAVAGPRERCGLERQLYEVLLSWGLHEAVHAASTTASLPLEPAVRTLSVPSRFSDKRHAAAALGDVVPRPHPVDRAGYGTHSMRRTKATLIYRRTKNLRAVRLLLGCSKLESTVRCLGIEVDGALEISEQTEI
jgi:hypothetical protein